MFRHKRAILLILVLALALFVQTADADYTFGTPVNLGPTVNTSAAEPNPSISADGLELYFESYRSGGYGSGDLYVSTRETTQDPWGVPLNLGPTINTSDYDITPCLSTDGLELYFVSWRSGTIGAIWTTKRATRHDDWDSPVNLGSIFNSGPYEFGPAISSDGLELYFSDVEVFQPGGYGLCDLWMISRSSVSDPWGQPMNLGPTVNSSADDQYPSISADGRMLFFTSERPGGLGKRDIWLTRRATPDDDWGEPVNLGPKVNTGATDAGPSISADGRTLYFWSGRGGGYGSWDLWQVSIEPIVDFNEDGIVDVADVLIMTEHWGENYSLCDIGPTPFGDGIVDAHDLIVLAEHMLKTPGPDETVLERRVSSSSDDAEEALNPGFTNWNYSSDLEIVHDYIDNGGEQLVGMTFRDIDIAPGALISNAYIEFVCDEILRGTDAAYFLIWGHLTPNSEGFVAPYVISNRPKTEAKVPWEPDPWEAGGQKIQTVDIAPIIQELVDQEDWVAGNAVEIIIGADPDKPAFSGVRVAESYDGSPSSAPLLRIEIAVQ